MGYKNAQQQREYQRKWIAARRKERLVGLKCVRCGSIEDIQIDHIDPKKKVTHRIWSWSKKRFDEEMKKCQALCGKCHKKKTREDFIKFVTHCPKGHCYDEKNTYFRNGTCRHCRTCDKLAHRIRRAAAIR